MVFRVIVARRQAISILMMNALKGPARTTNCTLNVASRNGKASYLEGSEISLCSYLIHYGCVTSTSDDTVKATWTSIFTSCRPPSTHTAWQCSIRLDGAVRNSAAERQHPGPVSISTITELQNETLMRLKHFVESKAN